MVAVVLPVVPEVIRGTEKSGAQLLLKAGTAWGTNVIAFGLWYWAVDRGGPGATAPARRAGPGLPVPADGEPGARGAGWRPTLPDYLYVSFTNAIAFSPTDAMPLTRRAKLMMMFESVISTLTVLLVAARAVNIFK